MMIKECPQILTHLETIARLIVLWSLQAKTKAVGVQCHSFNQIPFCDRDPRDHLLHVSPIKPAINPNQQATTFLGDASREQAGISSDDPKVNLSWLLQTTPTEIDVLSGNHDWARYDRSNWNCFRISIQFMHKTARLWIFMTTSRYAHISFCIFQRNPDEKRGRKNTK